MESDAPVPPRWRERLLGRFAPAYWLVLVGALLAAWTTPRVGWDLIAYVAAASDPHGTEPTALHTTAYAELEALAGPERARVLRGEPDQAAPADARQDRGVAYRRRIAAEPDALVAQLGFYRGRLLYLALIRGLGATGLGAARAVVLVSVLGGLLYGVVLLFWLARHLPGPYAPLVGAVTLLAAGAGRAMSMTTPDMLAAGLLVTGAWLLVELRRTGPAVATFALALLVRDDHALLVAGLLVAGLVPASGLPRLARHQVALGLALAAGAVLACRLLGEVHPAWVTWRHTFVEYMAFPLEEAGPPDLGQALSYTLRSLPKLLGGRVAITLLLAGAACLLSRRERGLEPGAGLALVATLAWLAHFALFPAEWSRLLLPYATLVAVGFAAVWRARGMPFTVETAQPMSDQASP